jgi:hypothetical protein
LCASCGTAIVVEGRRQTDIVKLTGYTREHIRRICKDFTDRRIGQQATPF